MPQRMHSAILKPDRHGRMATPMLACGRVGWPGTLPRGSQAARAVKLKFASWGSSALLGRHSISKIALVVSIIGCSSAHAGPTGPEGGNFPDYEVVTEEAAVEPMPKPEGFLSFDTGYAWTEDSNFYYADFWAALNGDWSRPGFFIEGWGGWGDYHYLNSDVPGGRVDAELTQASGLLGYQAIAGKVILSAAAGVDWQDNRLSPNDPSNPVSGSQTNFIVTAGVKTPLARRLDLKLNGGYSLVNETYWAKGRIGYKFGASRRFKIGPEGAFYGNENQNVQGVGAFVSVPLSERLDLSFAGGFKFVGNEEFFESVETGFETLATRGSFGGLGGLTDGAYGSVTVSTWY